jgi:hypothetical protein
MEEPEEPVDEEYEDEEPRKGKATKIVAIVIVAAILGAGGVWYLFFSNAPPVARFRTDADDLLLRVSADATTDPDGNIAAYVWNWGDSSPASQGIQASHTYASEDNYTVTLTVTDTRGSASSANQRVWIRYAPSAVFTARTEQMTVTFDASRSLPSRNNPQPIVAYAWDFGDGSQDSGVTVAHVYSVAQKYRVWLNVTDALGRLGTTSRFVSPASSTVDIVVDRFFEAGCPYGDYWFLRKSSYGDVILNNVAPCADYYPWVLITAKDPQTGRTLSDVNPSYVYTLYRFNATVRNFPGYNLLDPLYLPVLNSSVLPAPGSFLDMDLNLEYLGNSLMAEFENTPWAVDPGLGDGFGYLIRGNITMDFEMSKRIFDVRANTPAEAQSWWTANTRFAASAGAVEARVASWLELIGKGTPPGTGKYDVYNAFEWYYVTDITDLNATVDPTTGETRVQVFWDGWGYEVLFARLSYWGSASYLQAVNSAYGSVQPLGWLPMESCWCEKARIDMRIGSSLDLNYSAIMGYHFESWGSPGSDGVLGTPDDLPSWVFTPYLMDYVPREGSPSNASQGYPNSELRWYEGLESVHGTPGSYLYGEPYEYLVAPTRWILRSGSSLTIILPQFEVPWYDPAQSTWNTVTILGDYVTTTSNMTLRFVKVDGSVVEPGDFYVWDARGKMMSFAGPWTWPTSLPLVGSPWIEFAPES